MLGWSHAHSKMLKDQAVRHLAFDVRRAQKFYLDDTFVDIAVEASTAPTGRILNMLACARLPYELTWIEFDTAAKLGAGRRIGMYETGEPTGVPERQGWLLRAIPADVCLVVPFMTSKEPPFNSGVFARGVGFAWSYSEEGRDALAQLEDDEHRAYRRGYPEVLGFLQDDGKRLLWGRVYKDVAPLLDWASVTSHKVGQVSLALAKQGYEERDGLPHKEALYNAIRDELLQQAGDLRLLTTILALLNTEDRLPAVRQGGVGGKLVGGRILPYFEYHRLAIRAPKNGVKTIWRHFAGKHGGHHRAHLVRQHLRRYKYVPEEHVAQCVAQMLCPDCGEGQVLIKTELGMLACPECNAEFEQEGQGTFRRSWVPEHQRGDASLGWVDKDYVVLPGR